MKVVHEDGPTCIYAEETHCIVHRRGRAVLKCNEPKRNANALPNVWASQNAGRSARNEPLTPLNPSTR